MGISIPKVVWQDAVGGHVERLSQAELQLFLVDAFSFMQGLDGAKGEKGDSGDKGDHGDPGPAVSCFPLSHFWPLTETCRIATVPLPCFLFLLRVSRVLQGSSVYPVPKERR